MRIKCGQILSASTPLGFQGAVIFCKLIVKMWSSFVNLVLAAANCLFVHVQFHLFGHDSFHFA